MIKTTLRWLIFLIVGILFSLILIVTSELTKFSHTNLAPFGGNSWAMWVYPLLIGLGFYFSSLLFKLGKTLLILLMALVISLVVFYLLYNNLLFMNPLPFGVNAQQIL